jgi:D-alanyl-lipoteichoic acid acyltransferase DltB (MBOAT superfamily)
MLFNSGVFLKFFAAFLLLYWLVRHDLRARNWLIVLASYLFYGWWDYRFLSLILISSVMDYGVGLALQGAERPRARTAWLVVSLVGNLAILGFFKYYDFFVSSGAALLAQMGLPFHARTLGIILPVGVSFYTFQSISYVIDVYRRELPATRSLVQFLAYVSFFPQLVAGPIERAAHLLPQFAKTRAITPGMLEEGCWLMVLGMFKKVVLADNLAPLADMVYQNTTFSGPAVALGTVAFAFQIYCDFSGYSDIARGTARVLGFDIMVNFNLPYAATNLREFWRRWHISLSTWLRDYLYIPLGGNRGGKARTCLNVFLTMLLGGLWHGAAWNFVLWGVWHGAGLVVHRVFRGAWERGASERQSVGTPRTLHAPRSTLHALSWLGTMLFVLYSWLLFRAGSLEKVVAMTRALGDFSVPPWWGSYVTNLVVFIAPAVVLEIWQHRTRNLLAPLTLPAWAKAGLQGMLVLAIILYWEKDKVPFIYFQF